MAPSFRLVLRPPLRQSKWQSWLKRILSALAAQFFIPAGTEPFVTTRIKMGQTSNVYALVKADGKWSMAVKEVKVTLGGCGG
jgi:predicted secreted protein